MTGGIGSGKSEVGKIFAELGAMLVDADQLAREAVAPGTGAYDKIVAHWPRAVRHDGSLDREAIAAIVFANAQERQFLSGIIHPLVREMAAQRETQAAPDQIVVHEVPLLFESGRNEFFDATVLVIATRELRIERVMARSGLGREEIMRRMAAQIQPHEAQKLATFTIENRGSREELRSEAQRVYEALRNLPPDPR